MTQSPRRTPSRMRSRVRRFLVMFRGEEVVSGEVSATGCENGTASKTDQGDSEGRIAGRPRADRLARQSHLPLNLTARSIC